MQDINPIRKTIEVKEDITPDSIDVREQLGVGESYIDTTTQKNDLPNKREQVSFSSLYTPESRRNVQGMQSQKSGSIDKNMYLRPRKKVSVTKIIFSFVGSLIFIGFLMYTFVFAEATVRISPVRKTIDVNKTIALRQEEIDMQDVVKTIVASSSKSINIKRRAAAPVNTKASGIIIITNNFDSKPQKLITNTRFESKDGKVYRIAESVTVPGKTSAGPGTLEVNVFADSTGESYNSVSSELSVPGFKGTPRYSSFTAKTKAGFSGGFSGTRDIVADEDILESSNKLTSDIKKDLDVKIANLIQDEDYIFLASNNIFTESDNRKELLLDKNLDYIKTIEVKTFYIKKNYIVSKLKEGNKDLDIQGLMIENTDKLSFTKPNDTNNSDLIFNVNGSLDLISDLDQVEVGNALAGAKRSEFQNKMSIFSGIAEAKPKFSPFWSLSFPKDIKHIKLEIVK